MDEIHTLEEMIEILDKRIEKDNRNKDILLKMIDNKKYEVFANLIIEETPDEFLESREAQEEISWTEMKEYLYKYTNMMKWHEIQRAIEKSGREKVQYRNEDGKRIKVLRKKVISE